MDRRFLPRHALIAPLVVSAACLLVGAPLALAQGTLTPGSNAPSVTPADHGSEAQKKSSTQKSDTPTPQASSPQGGTAAVVMDLSALESVIGKSVKSAAGEDLGRIVDLLVTTSGQVRAAVIDFGGILGVGSRKVAVDWKALDFSNFTKDGTVKLGLTRNQVRVSPEYKSGEPVVILQEGKPDEGKSDQLKPDSAGPANNGDSKADATTGSPKHDGAK